MWWLDLVFGDLKMNGETICWAMSCGKKLQFRRVALVPRSSDEGVQVLVYFLDRWSKHLVLSSNLCAVNVNFSLANIGSHIYLNIASKFFDARRSRETRSKGR